MLIDRRLIGFLTEPCQEQYLEWFLEILQKAVAQGEIVEVDQTKKDMIIVVADHEQFDELKRKAKELQKSKRSKAIGPK